MKLNFKKYLIISALAIIMAGCETTTSEPTIDDPNNPKSLIAGIIERSPKAPNAKPEAEALRKKALRYVFLGDNLEEDTKNALSTINKAIEMDQANYSLYAARGLIHRDFVKDNDKALDDYNRAIAFNPNEVSLYFNRALVNLALQNVSDAVNDYNTVIEKSDDTYNGKFFRANAYQSLGAIRMSLRDFDLAEANLEWALEAYSDLYNQSKTNNDILAFQSSYQQRYEQCKELLDLVKKMKPKNKK